MKARLALSGIREMISFCKENEVEFDQCGKIVVATNTFEEKILNDIAKTGKLAGVNGLKFLDSREFQKENQILKDQSSLSPWRRYYWLQRGNEKFVSHILEKDGKVLFNQEIKKVNSIKNKEILSTAEGEKEFDLIIIVEDYTQIKYFLI